MRLSALLLVILMLEPSPAVAAKVHQRLARCATVVEEILNVPDGLPRELLDKAECVVVIPSMKKFALGIGGSYGRGAMTCRRGENFTGSWGSPAMVRLEGGNIGFQLGGQATDFFLLVMNPKGAESMLKSKVKLGADAAAVAGPKGRAAEAATDAYMHAEILSYSRARGLFAGVSVEGSTLRQDWKANRKLYGREIPARQVLLGSGVPVPGAGRRLVSLLQKASPRNRSKQLRAGRR